jgi:dipeptidase
LNLPQDDPSEHSPYLSDSRFYWDEETVYTLAKNTFNNFKKAYSSQPEIDEEKAEKKIKHYKKNRRSGRRNEVRSLYLSGPDLTGYILESQASQDGYRPLYRTP